MGIGRHPLGKVALLAGVVVVFVARGRAVRSALDAGLTLHQGHFGSEPILGLREAVFGKDLGFGHLGLRALHVVSSLNLADSLTRLVKRSYPVVNGHLSIDPNILH